MYSKQYSSRIQRKRGIKVKHALRICVLVAVCFWLIYQVKHFHEDSDAKGSMHGGSSGGLIKIRKKDRRSLYHKTLTDNKHHNQATEEEETTEAVENTLEEVSSTDKKVEEEDEALGDGDGETDEHEVKKLDTKVGREEDGVDSAAEGEITDDGNGRWKENFVEDGDRGAKSYSEAREEFYNADDASSAVTRDNHTQTTENENEVVGISDQHHEKILEQENKENPGKEAYSGEMKKRLEVDGGGKSEDSNPSSATDIATNVTTSETKENNLDSPEKDSSQNNTLTESHNATQEASNNTTDVTTQNPKLSEQNVTRSRPELDHDQIIVTKGTSTEGSNIKAIITLELANNSTLDVEDNQSDSNSTGHTASKNSESDFEDFSEPSNNTDSFTFRSNHSLEDGTNTRKNENVSAESVTSNGTDEVLESAITGNPKKVHTISTDLSDIQSSDSSLRWNVSTHS